VKFKSMKGTTARTLSLVSVGANILLLIPFVLAMLFVLGVGAVGAVAKPNFDKFQCRSMQSEAKGNLKSFYVSEESYRAENDTYTGAGLSWDSSGINSVNPLGFSPRGQKIRYRYTVLEAGPTSFRAEAVGTGDVEGDRWEIDQQNNLVNTSNACQ
jgi:Tfp pilus assembly protein PilE